MLFNSLDFAIFLPVCFFVYWFLAHKTGDFKIYQLSSQVIFFMPVGIGGSYH